MRILKLLLAGAALGVILAAFRDQANRTWSVPSLSPPREGDVDDEAEEPVLGYDGMDQETLIDWLDDADLDRDTLERMHRYEALHRDRGPVLEVIEDRLQDL